jgi:two-component sensor histidine kinase
MRAYVEELVTTFLHAHQGMGGTVRTTLDLEEMEISHDHALPMGLILNELLSNSVKHAFLDGKAGKILISLRGLGEKMELRYRDDGPGLPTGMDLSRGSSLGLKLVYNLAARQLLGTVELVPGPGAGIVVRFPVRKTESTILRSRGGEPISTR